MLGKGNSRSAFIDPSSKSLLLKSIDGFKLVSLRFVEIAYKIECVQKCGMVEERGRGKSIMFFLVRIYL
jgi:hypothetical protein